MASVTDGAGRRLEVLGRDIHGRGGGATVAAVMFGHGVLEFEGLQRRTPAQCSERPRGSRMDPLGRGGVDCVAAEPLGAPVGLEIPRRGGKTGGGTVVSIRHRKTGRVLAKVPVATLAAADLRGLVLMDGDLRNADLRGADLRGADLCNADLSGANLAGADLSRVVATNADFVEVDMRGVIASDTILLASRFRGANLHGADLTRASLGMARLEAASLTEARLCRADFAHAHLRGADATGADCSGANFFATQMGEICLRHADMTGSNFTQADLRHADLRDGVLELAVLAGTLLRGADLARACFKGTVLARCSDLAEARGLDEVQHLGESSIDVQTLRMASTRLPAEFLAGVASRGQESASERDSR